MSQGDCSKLKSAHPCPGEPLHPAPKLFVGNGGDFLLRLGPQVGTREEPGRSHLLELILEQEEKCGRVLKLDIQMQTCFGAPCIRSESL